MEPRPSLPHVHILYVDDSEADRRLAQEMFATSTMPNTLHVVRDGAEALAFLMCKGHHGGAPRPGLILMDINLPAHDGHETAAAIRARPEFADIPVVMLTSSDAPDDVQKARGRANAYITKPGDLDDYFQVVYAVEEFWHAQVANVD